MRSNVLSTILQNWRRKFPTRSMVAHTCTCFHQQPESLCRTNGHERSSQMSPLWRRKSDSLWYTHNMARLWHTPHMTNSLHPGTVQRGLSKWYTQALNSEVGKIRTVPQFCCHFRMFSLILPQCFFVLERSWLPLSYYSLSVRNSYTSI